MATSNLLVLYTGGTIGMQLSADGLAPASGFEARLHAQQAQQPEFPHDRNISIFYEFLHHTGPFRQNNDHLGSREGKHRDACNARSDFTFRHF